MAISQDISDKKPKRKLRVPKGSTAKSRPLGAKRSGTESPQKKSRPAQKKAIPNIKLGPDPSVKVVIESSPTDEEATLESLAASFPAIPSKLIFGDDTESSDDTEQDGTSSEPFKLGAIRSLNDGPSAGGISGLPKFDANAAVPSPSGNAPAQMKSAPFGNPQPSSASPSEGGMKVSAFPQPSVQETQRIDISNQGNAPMPAASPQSSGLTSSPLGPSPSRPVGNQGTSSIPHPMNQGGAISTRPPLPGGMGGALSSVGGASPAVASNASSNPRQKMASPAWSGRPSLNAMSIPSVYGGPSQAAGPFGQMPAGQMQWTKQPSFNAPIAGQGFRGNGRRNIAVPFINPAMAPGSRYGGSPYVRGAQPPIMPGMPYPASNMGVPFRSPMTYPPLGGRSGTPASRMPSGGAQMGAGYPQGYPQPSRSRHVPSPQVDAPKEPVSQPSASRPLLDHSAIEEATIFDKPPVPISVGMKTADNNHKRKRKLLIIVLLLVIAAVAGSVFYLSSNGIIEIPDFLGGGSQPSGSQSGGASTSDQNGGSDSSSTPAAPSSGGGAGTVIYQYTAQTSDGITYSVEETAAFDDSGNCVTTTMKMRFPTEQAAKDYADSLIRDYGSNISIDSQEGTNVTVTIDNSNLHLNREEYENALRYSVDDLVILKK